MQHCQECFQSVVFMLYFTLKIGMEIWRLQTTIGLLKGMYPLEEYLHKILFNKINTHPVKPSKTHSLSPFL